MNPVVSMRSEEAQHILNYQFQQPELLEEALTHASIAGHRLESNERLEFLGDAILGFIVCEYLFANFTDLLEGELTKIKSTVVSRKVCAQISKRLDLSSLLILGKGVSGRSGLPGSIAAAVLESIIGAIYLDGGIEPARRFIIDHFREFIDDAAQSAHQHNFKSVLQQYAQKNLPSMPAYILLDEKGPDHAKAFEVCVEMEGRRFPSAWANSKKDAEQQAALLALCNLGLAAVEQAGRVVLSDSLLAQIASQRPSDPRLPNTDSAIQPPEDDLS